MSKQELKGQKVTTALTGAEKAAKMPDKAYNILKWIAAILLPALGVLYFTLSGIWGLPYGEQIVGTITAVDLFLGVLLGISTNAYNKTKN